jgi:pilus assembly protein CpaF
LLVGACFARDTIGTKAIERPGFAPNRHLLLEPEITEVMINGPDRLFVERAGRMFAVDQFLSPTQLNLLVANLIEGSGRAVNHKSPMVDFRLEDGSRVNIVIAPVALGGPVVTIRKFTRSLRALAHLVSRGALTQRMATFLEIAVKARLNTLLAGGAGSGKTTMLGLLAGCIQPSERLVVIEDTAELELRQPHVVRMECKPPNLEGSGGIPLSELLKNALRMRPTRILVGEVRGEEAFEMLHAMSSGHDGTLAVLHASSPAHALARLEVMLLSRGLPMPSWAVQRMIARSVDLVVQFQLFPDGSRRVTHIAEVCSASDEEVQTRTLFEFRHTGFDEQGSVLGHFVSHGVHPKFEEKMRLYAGSHDLDALIAKEPA